MSESNIKQPSASHKYDFFMVAAFLSLTIFLFALQLEHPARRTGPVAPALPASDPRSCCKIYMPDFGEQNPTFPSWEELGLSKKELQEMKDSQRGEFATPMLAQGDNFQDGLKRVDVKGKIGVQRKDGSFALQAIYDYIDFPQATPSQWIACAVSKVNGGGFGFVNKSGKELAQKFLKVMPFKEGLAAVRTEQGWGYLNEAGEMAIPCKFPIAKDFSEGLAAVGIDNKWGYIDHSGEFVVQPCFDSASNFQHGLAKVRYLNFWGILRKGGSAQHSRKAE